MDTLPAISRERMCSIIVAIPIPLYLASDEATYYEGAVLVVAGGRTGARQREGISSTQTIGEISRFARGERESATTFSGILDLLRGVVNGVRFRQHVGQRFQS